MLQVGRSVNVTAVHLTHIRFSRAAFVDWYNSLNALLLKHRKPMPDPKRILVLCTANSARSQMAEGWFRQLGGARVAVESAGARPSQVNPVAVEVMAERGVDISGHRSKSLDEFRQQSFDYVITVCDNAAQSCPVFPGPAERIHWSFPDPAAAPEGTARAETFRAVRDGLEERIRSFLREL